jgi:hypothetical protein
LIKHLPNKLFCRLLILAAFFLFMEAEIPFGKIRKELIGKETIIVS